MSMNEAKETDQDDRGFGMHEEQALYGRKFERLRGANMVGLFYEAAMPNPKWGWNLRFRLVLGLFRVLEKFPELDILRTRKIFTCCPFTIIFQRDQK